MRDMSSQLGSPSARSGRQTKRGRDSAEKNVRSRTATSTNLLVRRIYRLLLPERAKAVKVFSMAVAASLSPVHFVVSGVCTPCSAQFFISHTVILNRQVVFCE